MFSESSRQMNLNPRDSIHFCGFRYSSFLPVHRGLRRRRRLAGSDNNGGHGEVGEAGDTGLQAILVRAAHV